MAFIIALYGTFLRWLMKIFAGMIPQQIEIQPGTIMNFWVPTRTTTCPSDKHASGCIKRKPAVVFLHGFALDGILTWQFQVLSLARKYDVYVPDFVFFGRSITERPERSAEFQAKCVAEGLKKLGINKCTLVGLSYGGMIGFKMAELYPDLVDSMVVTDSVSALTESISKASLRRIGFSSWSEFLLPNTVKGVKVLFEIGSYKLPPIPNWLLNETLEMILENRKDKVKLLEALVVDDKDYKVGHFKQKIHILTGKNDLIFDVNTVDSIKSQLGDDTKLQYVERAGHLLPLERPFLYNKLLKEALKHLVEDI